VASATLFGLHHYIFHNWLAVALTLLGGIKFVLTYRRSRSLPLTCVEHAIYGCLVFTVGLGVFFHGGSASVLTDMRGLAR
jgi:membrane protease YdiL (CAAX protease family)